MWLPKSLKVVKKKFQNPAVSPSFSPSKRPRLVPFFKVVQLTIGGWDFRVATAGCCGLNILKLQWFKGLHLKLRSPLKSASILQFQLSFYLIKFLPSNMPIATIIKQSLHQAPGWRPGRPQLGVGSSGDPKQQQTWLLLFWSLIYRFKRVQVY